MFANSKYVSNMNTISKTKLLSLSVVFISFIYTHAQTDKQDLIDFEYEFIFDTLNLKNRIYDSFTCFDIEGNLIERSTVNEKPCFIYYFMAHCAPCSFEMPVINQLNKEFGDKIEFVAFTPIPQEDISTYYPTGKAPQFTIISMPLEYFKTGFPMVFLLDKANNILIRQNGGTTNDVSRKLHYEILKYWCLKAINLE
jgi:thiol-disulfide isomerase/thioredoxin